MRKSHTELKVWWVLRVLHLHNPVFCQKLLLKKYPDWLISFSLKWYWHNWRNKNELISDVLLWTLSHRRASVRWPVRTYWQQLCTETGCSLEDQKWEMIETDGVRELKKSMQAAWDDDDDMSCCLNTLDHTWYITKILIIYSYMVCYIYK